MTEQESRRLRRFFSSSPLPEPGSVIYLVETETHHLKDILRLKAGDRCLVADGSGREAEAKITRFTPGGGTWVTVEKILTAGRTGGALVLRACIALPQKGKMDFIVEKAQELAVDEILPIETERTVVKMNQESKVKSVLRWRRIVQEASKQSGVLSLTAVESPRPFREAVTEVPSGGDLVIFHPAADAMAFSEFIDYLGRSKTAARRRLHLFFGPEGGFTEKEVNLARIQSGRRVSLGRTILKVDTAFLSAAAALRLLFP